MNIWGNLASIVMKRRRRPQRSRFFLFKRRGGSALAAFSGRCRGASGGPLAVRNVPKLDWFENWTKTMHPRRLHPGRLRWNLQIIHLERKMIFQTFIIMFHVNLLGCNSLNLKNGELEDVFFFPAVYSQVPCESSGVYIWNSGSIHRVIH